MKVTGSRFIPDARYLGLAEKGVHLNFSVYGRDAVMGTFDVMFDDAAKYQRVKDSGVINAHRVAGIYGVRLDDVLVCRPYDPAVAFKITIRRPVRSGDIQDRDVYGCQQHVPLTMIEVP